MGIMMALRPYVGLTLGLSCLSACGALSSYTPTPEAQMTVLGLANDYLRIIVQGKTRQVESMILWIPYVEATGVSKDQVRADIKWLSKRWPLDNHPLLGLQLTEINVNEDDAFVRLKKLSLPEQPEIVISLQWIGNGWLIVGDTLFTKDGVISHLKAHAAKTDSTVSKDKAPLDDGN